MNTILPPPPHNYTVDVLCTTYNQSKYIEQTFNGFTMQSTTFPFVCLIFDDASTDGEDEVIRNYLNEHFDLENAIISDNVIAYVIIATHRQNTNCTFAVHLLKENHYQQKKSRIPYFTPWREKCKYEALCEGDDYWIDPLKLQKQVDFMEEHPEYTGIYTNAFLEDASGEKRLDRFGHVKEDFDLTPELMIEGGGGVVRTVSDLHRLDVMTEYPDFANKCYVGDYPLHIFLSLKGKCRMLVEPMVVYRTAALGSWSEGKKKRTIEQEIAIRQNFNEMLDGFDEYSNWRYHDSVLRTETYEVYDLLLRNKQHWKLISKSFPKVVPHFNGMVKIDNFLMTHHLSWVYNVLWKIRVSRGKRS